MLHIPTLLLALLLGFLLLTLELGVSQSGLRARPELRVWTRGCWALLCGFAAFAARPVVGDALSIVLGNGLVCLGLAIYAQAIHQLLGRRGPQWVMRAQWPIWLGLVWMLPWPLNQRTALMSLVYVALMAPGVALIWRQGWQVERSLRTVAITQGLAMMALLLRAVHAWFNPADYGELMQASLGQGLTFLVAFVGLLGSGFGFVLAVFERVAHQMEELANHDGLTGCWNRSATDALLEHELVRARRTDAPVAFALMDLDHFKQVNDQHGHLSGDEVLRKFASVVRSRLRASDVFGRTGGEEFGLVLPGTDSAGALWLLEEIRREVAAMVVTSERGAPLQITVSAGIAVCEGQASMGGDRLYGQADQALYEAKHAGRNRVEVHGLSGAAEPPLPLA